MPATSPAAEFVEEPNVLERRAADYLSSKNGRSEAELRERRPEEVAAIQRIQRRAVIWAFVAGAVSGGLIGSAEIFVRQGYLEGMEGMDWREQLPYWAAFTGFAAVVSGIEILFLYWNALRSTAQLSTVTGGPLTGNPFAALGARGRARAALEFPNPRDPLYGIDPYARTPRWKLEARAMMYRLKVGVTSFISRILLRRMLGRVALRGFIPLLTGPLYAIWNAVITWRIMREARLRSLGPYAVQETVGRIAEASEGFPEEDRRLILEAVGEMIIHSHSAHPNFAFLLWRLFDELQIHQDSVDVDWPAQKKRLSSAEETVKSAVLTALMLTSMLDGRLSRSEKALLAEAHLVCGRVFHSEAFDHAYKKFLDGRRLEAKDFEAMSSRTAGEH